MNIPSKRILLFLLRVRKFVCAQSIQVIHAQSAYDALLAAIATLGLRTCIVQTMHSYEFAKNHVSKFAEKLSFGFCKKTVFVSQCQMQRFAQIHHQSKKDREKQTVVYNGVDFTRFQYSQGGSSPIVQMAMVGNFVPEKDQYFICRFLHELQLRQCAFQFYFIAGKKEVYAECYDRCTTYCHEHGLDACVHFVGETDDVPSLLANMDAFVYSSTSETFGLAVVEAVSAALPTFVNDLEVFKVVTQGGELAVLYKTGDVEDLAVKFVDFLTHKDQYVSHALANAATIRQKYSITAHTDILFKVYSQIV